MPARAAGASAGEIAVRLGTSGKSARPGDVEDDFYRLARRRPDAEVDAAAVRDTSAPIGSRRCAAAASRDRLRSVGFATVIQLDR